MSRTDTETPAPPQVRRAAQLLGLLVVLMVVRTILTVTLHDEYSGNLALAFVTLVMLGGLLTLCSVGVVRRQRWARIVGVMFASVAVLGGVSSVLNPSSPAFAALGLVGAGIAVTAIVFLCSGAAAVYFRRKPRRPAA